MRRPFERLVEMVDALEEPAQVTLGELSRRWDEPVQRIMDALDASKMLRGVPTYITFTKGNDGRDVQEGMERDQHRGRDR